MGLLRITIDPHQIVKGVKLMSNQWYQRKLRPKSPLIKGLILLCAVLIMVGVISGCSSSERLLNNEVSEDNYIQAKVVRVVDGDSVKGSFGNQEETIRLLLVDTPETVHPDKPVQPFGPESSDFAREMLEGKDVQIEIDVSERDKYGRLLAYLWIGDEMFNELLLEQGLARVAYVYPPNIKYVEQFRDTQKKAQLAGIGIWSVENYAQEDGFNEEVTADPKEEEIKQPASSAASEIELVTVDLGDEYFTIKNNSDEDLNLTGWSVLSVEGNQSNQNIWNNKGDPAELMDASGAVVDNY
jgi:endonuclease YncB( thermonuclease family)